MLRPALLTLSLSALFLSGCALTSTAPQTAVTGDAIQGKMYGGQQPVVGAHVYLMAASSSAYGAASTSLLKAASTGLSDSVGAYVLTKADGSFNISNDYTCTANTQVYLYGTGGNASGGVNSKIGLLAALGNCPSSGNFATATPYLTVNEATTIAMAYATAGYAVDPTHIASSGTTLALQGIKNAFANAANLVDLVNGYTRTVSLAGNANVPTTRINMLANVLAACINSSDTPTFANCTTLFANAPGASTPTDTAAAAINIAHHAGATAATISALYSLVSSNPPFQPTLTGAPNDLALVLEYTRSSVDVYPDGIDIDSAGNIWTSTTYAMTVNKYSPLGALLLGPIGDASINYPRSLSIDSQDNIWLANTDAGVTKISNTGAILSPAGGFAPNSNPFSIAIDNTDGVWLAQPNTGTYTRLTNAGAVVTGSPFAPTNLSGLNSFAFGSGNSGYLAGQSMPGIAKISQANAVLSGSGYGDTTIPFSGIAIDSSAALWTGGYGSSIYKTAIGGGNYPSTVAYSNSVLSNPDTIAVDGDGNVFAGSNDRNHQIAEFSNSGASLSPTGFANPQIDTAYTIAIDGSGNVWVSSDYGYLTEFIGAAAPVVTPRSTAARTAKNGARP